MKGIQTCALILTALLLSPLALASKSDKVVYKYPGNGHKITFYFAGKYETGQFANGDFWVHNNGKPVVISRITPKSREVGGRTINGTMVNPAESELEGYDSAPRDMKYSAELNRDPGATGEKLVAEPGSSVIKAVSKKEKTGRPAITEAVVLTVLDKTPPEGSFRPPYTGTDKTIPGNAGTLDMSLLHNYRKTGGEPDIRTLTRSFSRVWLEHNTQWTSRDIHPKYNMPTYGRDLAREVATGVILLNLDFPEKQKKQLYINMIQYGIDLYGVAENGGVWYNNGGHNLGRKLPLILAANALNNPDMKAYADPEKHMIFQDDQQHFYVSEKEVQMTHSSQWKPDKRADRRAYTEKDIGTAEWGIRHHDKPQADNADWSATYRDVNGPSQTMTIFAARMLGVKDQWNWPAVFDYTDRYYKKDSRNSQFPDWFRKLWKKYRSQLGE